MIRLRTAYSFRGAYGTLDKYIDLVGQPGPFKNTQFSHLPQWAPITDTSSSYGWVKWDKLCREAGKVPIFGVELAVSDDITPRYPAHDFWTFLPHALSLNMGGSLAPLNELIELAYRNFKQRPTLLLSDLKEIDGVTAIIGRRTPASWLEGFSFGYYMMGPGLSKRQAALYEDQLFFPVLGCDNRYPLPENKAQYEILAGRLASNQSWPQHYMGTLELIEYCTKIWGEEATARALERTYDVLERASRCPLARAELPPAIWSDKSLKKLCRAGAKRLNVDLKDPTYKARLKRELKLIYLKGYANYFLIVAEIVAWAKERMLVGPARGSSCGSLVCYLLDITTVDPIPHGLYFERFVDINREDMPDIDIDFPEDRRGEVIDHISETYGPEFVGQLGTTAVFRPRSILKEAGAALGIPPGFTSPVADAILERSSGDARALDTLQDSVEGSCESGEILIKRYPEFASAYPLEGHPKHASRHASAVILTDRALSQFAPYNPRDGVLMLDKKDAEELNILKVDVLGLTQLSIIEDACNRASINFRALYDLPLDNEKVFRIFGEKLLGGIFQFDSPVLRGLCNFVRVENFDDISAITALARPGPLVSGNTVEWGKRRTSGKWEVEELLRPSLEETMGVVIYQEQVMNIGREVGGLSWEDVTALRKAMSKSLGKEFFDQYGDPWKKGAIAKGMSPKRAEKLWDDLCAYGSWSFNKSHSVAYGIISYWCGWLKAFHPLEFYAATLDYEKNTQKKLSLLREAVESGYEYEPYNRELSEDKWIARGNRLIGPLSGIYGIGPKSVATIMGDRRRGDEPKGAIAKKLETGRTDIDELYPVSTAYKRLVPNPIEHNIITTPTPLAEIAERDGEVAVIIGIPEKFSQRDVNEEINVARRGYRITQGPTTTLNMRMLDDTGDCIAIINRWKFDSLGKDIVKRGDPSNTLLALKGTVSTGRGDGTFLFVEGVKFLGYVK